MPYIPEGERHQLRSKYMAIQPRTPGELNFALTTIVLDYLERIKDTAGVVSYGDYNEAIGVLECMKLEMYRRTIAPYEDAKCEQNGDVY